MKSTRGHYDIVLGNFVETTASGVLHANILLM